MTEQMKRWGCPACGSRFMDADAMRNGGVCPQDGKLLKRDSSSPADNEVATEVNSQRAEPDRVMAGTLHVNGSQVASSQDEQLEQQSTLPQDSAPVLNVDEGFVCLQIVPVKGQKREVASIVQLLNALVGVKPLSFEIVGLKNERLLMVRCHRRHVPFVKGQITAVYGSPEIHELPPEADPIAVLNGATYRTQGLLELSRPAALPLRTYRELERNDPIMPITGASFDLTDREVSISQMIVHETASEDWAAEYRQELLAIRRRQMGLVSGGQYFRLIALCLALGVGGCSAYSLYWGAWFQAVLFGVLAALLVIGGFRVLRVSDVEWSEAQEEMVARKIEMPAYQVELRLLAGAETEGRAKQIAVRLADAYRVFSVEAGNSLMVSRLQPVHGPSRAIGEHRAGQLNLLGDEEIATLWHLPIVDMPDMMRISRVNHVLPDKWQVDHEKDGWYIGDAMKSAGAPIPVWLPKDTMRSHMLLLGRTGMGKTTVLEHMVEQIAQDPERSLVIIDPHGDMAKRMLGLIPRSRIEDTYYLDFSDEEQKPGFNPLDLTLHGNDPEKAALAIKEIAHAIFGRYWGPRMEMPFENAALAIALLNQQLPTDKQYTILSMLSLIELSPKARQSFLKDQLPDGSVLKRSVIKYFERHFDNLQKSFQEQVGMPVVSKLEPFQRNSFLIDVFGQSQCSINVADEIKNGKIFILRTGAANLSREHSSFIGSLFLNVVIRAIYSQIDMPEEDRTQVTIVVDESQMFKGVDYGAMLAEMRKFGANAILSVQGPSTIGRASASDEQDDDHAFQKIMENIDALFVFRTSGEAAQIFSKTEFPNEAAAPDLINLDKFESFVRFSSGRKVSGPFKVSLAPPLAADEVIAAEVLARRPSYLVPVELAKQNAVINLERLDVFDNDESAEKLAAANDSIRSSVNISLGEDAPDLESPDPKEIFATEFRVARNHAKPGEATEEPKEIVQKTATVGVDEVKLPGERNENN